MKDYQVVTARRIADLQQRINEMLKEGYSPQGGIAMLDSDEMGEKEPHVAFAQAMIREQPEGEAGLS